MIANAAEHCAVFVANGILLEEPMAQEKERLEHFDVGVEFAADVAEPAQRAAVDDVANGFGDPTSTRHQAVGHDEHAATGVRIEL